MVTFVSSRAYRLFPPNKLNKSVFHQQLNNQPYMISCNAKVLYIPRKIPLQRNLKYKKVALYIVDFQEKY